VAKSGGRARGKGTALLFGGALLVVAFAAWLAQSGPSSAAKQPDAAAPPADEHAPAELRGSAAEDSRLRVESTEIVAPADAAIELADVPAIEAPLASGIAVRVVLGRSDEPVPLAVVAYAEFKSLRDASVLEVRAKGSPLESRVWNVKRYRADPDGVVLLPRTHRFAHAFCEHGDLWGWVELESEPRYEAIPLRLMPDADVAVRVVSGRARAAVAGAEVALRYEVDPESVETLATAFTDASGLARFLHIRQYTSYYWAHTEKIRVELAGVFAGDEGIEIDPADVPPLVELEAGVLTALDVSIVGLDGRPVQEAVQVIVGLGSAPENAIKAVSSVAYGGRVAFEQLGPTLDVALVGRTRHGARTAVVEALTAPNHGGRIPVTLVLSSAGPRVTGRLLTPDGAPVVERDLVVLLGDAAALARVVADSRTDADGRFELSSGMLSSNEAMTVRLTLKEDAPDLAKTLTLDAPVVGERDLGDLRLERVPLLISGRVVDDGGSPVAEARVSNRPRPSFGAVLDAAPTGADGGFALYGVCAGEIGLHAAHPLYAPAEQFAVPGARDVELVLHATGAIGGGVLLDEEWLCDFTEVRARPMGADEWTENAWVERPGDFVLERLRPGKWAVSIVMEDEGDVGVVVADVEVVAGRMTRDPRLRAVDLRGKAAVKTFRIVDADGEPIRDGEVSHRAPNELEWLSSVSIEHGRAHVFTVLPEVDLFVRAPDHRSAFVPRAREDRDIVLAAGIPVRFRCAETMNQADRFVLVGLAGAEDGMPLSTLTPDLRGDVETLVPHGGEYDVRWRGYRSGERGPRFSSAVPQTVSIRHSSAPQDVELIPPPDVLAFLRGDG
jgi:hypothetical protein